MCIFCKIIKGEIPSTKVFENEDFIIFKDINKKAVIHWLCVPKKHYAFFSEADNKDLDIFSEMVKKVRGFFPKQGYRLVINQGETAGQEVMHIHMHVLGGEQLGSIN